MPFSFHWYTGVVPVLVPVAVNVTLVPWQMLPAALEVIDTAGVTAVLTTIVTDPLVAVAGLAQEALLVNTQVITSPLIRLLADILLPVAIFTPFFFH